MTSQDDPTKAAAARVPTPSLHDTADEAGMGLGRRITSKDIAEGDYILARRRGRKPRQWIMARYGDHYTTYLVRNLTGPWRPHHEPLSRLSNMDSGIHVWRINPASALHAGVCGYLAEVVLAGGAPYKARRW